MEGGSAAPIPPRFAACRDGIRSPIACRLRLILGHRHERAWRATLARNPAHPRAPVGGRRARVSTSVRPSGSITGWRLAAIGLVGALAVGIGVAAGATLLNQRGGGALGAAAAYVPADAPFYVEVRLEPSAEQDAALRELLGTLPADRGDRPRSAAFVTARRADRRDAGRRGRERDVGRGCRAVVRRPRGHGGDRDPRGGHGGADRSDRRPRGAAVRRPPRRDRSHGRRRRDRPDAGRGGQRGSDVHHERARRLHDPQCRNRGRVCPHR